MKYWCVFPSRTFCLSRYSFCVCFFIYRSLLSLSVSLFLYLRRLLSISRFVLVLYSLSRSLALLRCISRTSTACSYCTRFSVSVCRVCSSFTWPFTSLRAPISSFLFFKGVGLCVYMYVCMRSCLSVCVPATEGVSVCVCVWKNECISCRSVACVNLSVDDAYIGCVTLYTYTKFDLVFASALKHTQTHTQHTHPVGLWDKNNGALFLNLRN